MKDCMLVVGLVNGCEMDGWLKIEPNLSERLQTLQVAAAAAPDQNSCKSMQLRVASGCSRSRGGNGKSFLPCNTVYVPFYYKG